MVRRRRASNAVLRIACDDSNPTNAAAFRRRVRARVASNTVPSHLFEFPFDFRMGRLIAGMVSRRVRYPAARGKRSF
jgi:hypothetical protein